MAPPASHRKRSLSMYAEPLALPVEDNVDETLIDSDDETEETRETGWTIKENGELLKAVRENLPKNDNYSYTRRLKLFEWHKISVTGRTSTECKSQLETLFKKLRHVRTVAELLQDAEQSLVNNPKQRIRSKSAFLYFLEDVRSKINIAPGKTMFAQASQLYKQLSEEERERYNKMANSSKVNTTDQRKKAIIQHELEQQEITPFVLFCKEEVTLGNYSKKLMRSKYKELPDDQKIVFVRKAISEVSNQSNNEIGSLSFLTKHEIRLMHGVKSTPSAYNIFVSEFCKDKTKNFRQASEAYRLLPDDEKKRYQAEADSLRSGNNKPVIPNLKVEKPDSELVSSKTADKPNNSQAKVVQNQEKDSPKKKKRESTSNASPVKRQKTSSLSESGTERKIKKEKISEPIRGPTSVYDYFCQFEYSGKPKKAKKAYGKLNNDEKRRIKSDYKKRTEKYMANLERYLQTLSKEEMIEYAARSGQEVIVPSDEDSLLSSMSE